MVTTQAVNGCTVPVVFLGNAGADWLGTSRGSSCEGPSHHSVLDSSQEASSFIRTDFGVPACFLP